MKKYAKVVWVVALLGLLAAQPGCMTLDHLMDPKAEISIYGGTEASLREMEDPQTGWWGTLFRFVDFFQDVGLSFHRGVRHPSNTCPDGSDSADAVIARRASLGRASFQLSGSPILCGR